MKRIRVLIADDSATGRRLLAGILATDPVFEIIALASNGKEAVNYAKGLKPDIISMDINMPLMDGIEATRIIMSESPAPVVIVSSIYNNSNVRQAIQELEAGAVTVMPKPHGPGHHLFEQTAAKYISTLKLMSEVKVVRRRFVKNHNGTDWQLFDNSESIISKESKIVAIGSSAGGPEALKEFLTSISPDFPIPIVIVQHLDPHFSKGFVDWINTFSPIPAKIAENGEKLERGKLYLPPTNLHLTVREGRFWYYNGTADDISSYKPSIDILFESVSREYSKDSIGVILSGMGRDGAVGLKKMKEAGAYTFAQDKNTSLIYGMPGEAVKIEAVCKVLSPKQIATQLNYIFT